MLSLEDAIKHSEEVAKDCETMIYCGVENYLSDKENVDNISECAMEHRQLAEWLKELKRYRQTLEFINHEMNILYSNVTDEYGWMMVKKAEVLAILFKAMDKVNGNDG